ncbi:MAG: nuclear transport factor 2 family protein [Nocardioides sp.]
MTDLGKVLDDFCAAFSAQDADRLRDLFVGDDASLLTSDDLVLRGLDHLHVFFDAYAAQTTSFSFSWYSREAYEVGAVGWVVALGQETAHRPEGPVTSPFRMTLVCRRVVDGWGIAHLHASSPS